ncbi:MAG TPA: hypothetical protein VLN45_12665, partial [Ignavibacteriaceae bacterium]|nr:hypothetical protein [Ignavibacteriaceae bacterium]
MLTPNEKRLIIYLKVLLIINFLFLVFCLVNLFVPSFSNLSTLFTINFSALSFVNILICWYAIADLRRFMLLVKLFAWQFVFFVIVELYLFLWADTSAYVVILQNSLTLKSLIIISLCFDVLNAVLIFILISSSEKAKYELKYFSPLQFKTLEALAEVVIYGDNETITNSEVAKNVDTYFKTFQAKFKWTMALVVTGLYFYPLLSLYPPLPYLSPYKRLEFLKKRFYRDIESRLIPEFWRVIAQGMIRIAKQLCYIGYYSDKRTF